MCEGPTIIDLLVAPDGRDRASCDGERIETAHTHGTGCTLASAIATGLGDGAAARGGGRQARGRSSGSRSARRPASAQGMGRWGTSGWRSTCRPRRRSMLNHVTLPAERL